MIEDLKKSLKNKKLLLPLIVATVLFTLSPNIAHAGWFVPFILIPIVTGVITGVTATVAGLATKGITLGLLILGVLAFGLALSQAFMFVGLSVLNWGISGTIFAHGMSMTNPANNVIIQIGWTLLRDLTNMFFILGLAYIGLATALNFASFDTKKTFIKLLIIALLINFTPVICGLIVDASNIIMNFFLSEVDFDQISSSYKESNEAMGHPDEKSAWQNIQYWVTRYFLNSLYGMTAGAVLMIFGVILVMRHLIIWILVILSPLAFFLYIFNFSKQWYQKWWGWFVSWSFIGIPAAFFLYLANHLMILAKTNQLEGATQNDALGPALSPYLITIVFMVIALITTLKIRVAGSSLIMNTANKAINKAKGIPGLVQKKAGAPLGAKAGALAGGALAGLAFGGAARKKAEADALARAGGRTLTGKEKRQVRQAGVEAGLKTIEENKRKTAALRERMGFKPRELTDLGPDELRELAEKSATTKEGLARKLGAMKKMIADNTMGMDQLKALAETPTTNKADELLRVQAIKKLVDNDDLDTSDPTKTTDMLAVMRRYPGISIDKLKKSHPDLEYLIDEDGYKKEVAKLTASGLSASQAEVGARFNIIRNRAKKMSAIELANISFEDSPYYNPTSKAHDTDEMVAIFSGLTPGKIKKIGEEARPERILALKKFTDTSTPEYKELMTKFPNGSSGRLLIDNVITAIKGDPNFK